MSPQVTQARPFGNWWVTQVWLHPLLIMDLVAPNHPLHYSKQTSPKLKLNKSRGMYLFVFFLLSQRHSHGSVQPGPDTRYISKQRSSVKHRCSPHPQHSAGWNLGLICYQTQLVLPADVRRPSVTELHFFTSCVNIHQGWSLMPLPCGAGLLLWAGRTLVPKGLSL